MAAVKQPFGFKPARSLNGNFNPAMRRYPVLSTGVRPLFIGDPVSIVSSNVVRTTSIVGAVTAVAGVVAQILDTNQKPLVFSQPTKGPYLPIGTAGYADVYVDPDNIYWSATDVTAAAVNVGAYVHLTAANSGGSNNLAGRSPLCVSVSDVTIVASTEFPFLILGTSMRDHLTNADWTEGVEVLIRPTRNALQI